MTSSYRVPVAVMLILFASIVSYAGLIDNSFVAFDDDEIIVRNQTVHMGLSLESVSRAFSLSTTTYWHPVTWLSLMLDYELFGLNPRAFHLQNLLLHALAALVLFAILSQLTKRIELSLIVALLFAVHPLNVESVAWAVERKSVLSTFIGLLAVWAYVYYARHPTLVRYLLVFILMGLSLLAKPGFVVLPALLLLLDYWPLGRLKSPPSGTHMSAGRARGLVPEFLRSRVLIEKIPFLILAIGVVAITLFSVQTEQPQSSIGLALRFENALVSLPAYLHKAFYPVDLAVFYPFPAAIDLWKVVGAGMAVSLITVLAFLTRQRRPYLLVGWCWFLVAIFPYLGFVQVRLWPAMADRFAYVPLIGIYVMIVWGIADALPRWRYSKTIASLATVAVILILVAVTRIQVTHWKDSLSLFSHAVAVAPDSPEMQYNLGSTLAANGHYLDAARALEKAKNLRPNRSEVRSQLANVYTMLGRNGQAIEQYKLAINLDPSNVEALFNLATRLDALGRPSEAEVFYRRFVDIAPPEYQAQRAYVLQRLGYGAR